MIITGSITHYEGIQLYLREYKINSLILCFTIELLSNS